MNLMDIFTLSSLCTCNLENKQIFSVTQKHTVKHQIWQVNLHCHSFKCHLYHLSFWEMKSYCDFNLPCMHAVLQNAVYI